MYTNLVAEMARNGISKKDMACEIGISRVALDNKIKEISDFTATEITTIQDKFFPNLDIKYLLGKS